MHGPYRSYTQVMAAYQSEHDHQRLVTGYGMCLRAVITMLGGPNTGIHDAALGYRMTSNVHTTGTPPAGAVLWWTGGSQGYGHVAVSSGAGYMWSTDLLRSSRVDKVPITLAHDKWGETYRGWSDNYCNQFSVSLAPTKVPSPPAVSLKRINAAQKIEQAAPRTTKTYAAGAVLVEKALVKVGITSDGGANIDGHLGTGYTAAVKAYQIRLKNYPADGVFGPKQFAYLSKGSGLFSAVA